MNASILSRFAASAGGVVAETVLWLAFWVGFAALTRVGWMAEEGVAVIAVASGIGAGALVVVDRRRWVVILGTGLVGVATYYFTAGLSLGLVVATTAANMLSCVFYAAVIRRFRDTSAGLGAPAGWAVLAATGAAAIRLLPAGVVLLAHAEPTSRYAATAVVELGLGSVVGYLTFASAVIAVLPWRPVWTEVRSSSLGVRASTVAIGAVGLLVFVTPAGSVIPGSQYLLIILLAIIASQWSFRVTAIITAATVVTVAIGLTHALGPFTGPADPFGVVQTQMLLLALTVTTFSLAAAVGQIRRSRETIASALALQRVLYDQAPVPVLLVGGDDAAPVLDANDAFGRLTGHSAATLTRRPLAQVLNSSAAEVAAGLAYGTDLRIGTPAGPSWVRLTRSGVLSDPDGRPDFRVVAVDDVTASHVSEQLLVEQSRRDPLTGLGNRAAFYDRLATGVDDGVRRVVVVVKIDGLRRVNAGAGPDLGDLVIGRVAERLRADVADAGETFRVASTEFALLVPGSDPDALTALVDRLRAHIAEPVVAHDEHLHVTARCGIVGSEHVAAGAGVVLRRADSALQFGKANSRAVVVFADGIDTPARAAHAVERLLHDAVATGTLHPQFQPITDVATGRVVGAEALVRLRDRDGTLIPPDVFLPLAAELGLTDAVDEQMLDHALRAAAAWRAVGVDIYVAVNATPRWLTAHAADAIAAALDRHRVPATSLVVEITEEGMLALSDDGVAAVHAVRSLGCHLAIDDFGTGYSGLTAFRSLPADTVKIDQSFIATIHDSGDRTLVASMIDLIHRFDKIAVAEGVETPEQLHILRELGCDRVQGFLISRPVDVDRMPLGSLRRA